ncbi:hypothetical protein L211DRAFT_813515 [Terfezia boudieri ATCC MYA-4762]|uniref:Uncharacterized protein n=1 Tax=Terfezia boudieri ATCC MYA-4762 TaxID=1051890 RepID=A0A3N4LBL4_9PEZI|nr:hypothetical protein L211DRAFT_813515 [Terfezia boudieri ATCC MYA-4762]
MEWSSEFRRKRQPTDDLNEEQPLSKRLSLLNLNYGSFNNINQPRKLTPVPIPKPPKKQRPSLAEQERMEVDNVVYVSDLDSDSESDADDKVVYLPDVERKLNRIPYQLVSERSKDLPTSTELVLYSVPSSISVPEQKDVVRRAIIESRQRLREKTVEAVPNRRSPNRLLDGEGTNQAANAVPNSTLSGLVGGTVNGQWGAWTPLDASMGIRQTENFEDPDAMEIE